MDFSGGVDSSKVSTIASTSNPNGLQRNQLAWMVNGMIRDGGITQRYGWLSRAGIADGQEWYQGGSVYERDEGYPYLLLSIGGKILKVTLEEPYTVTNVSTTPLLQNPSGELYSYFCQAETYTVIQAGDYITKPLIWDGTSIRRSNGIIGVGNMNNEIPAAGPMDYYLGRLWYAGVPTRRHYCAGDIVQGTSGTIANRFLDAVLHVTENPLAVGGDGFVVPTQAGNIRALKHTANLDNNLGVSDLFIFTRRTVYGLAVPVTRADWIQAGNGSGGTTNPVQKLLQINQGSVNDRGIVVVNGDLFYQSLEPAIRSLTVALRYFQQWGNTAISANENRILQFNDRSLMSHCTGVEFDNRLLESALPKRVNCGIVHQAIIPMDFDPISSFGASRNPSWEGMYEGLDILQMFSVDYGGQQRCFAVVVSRIDGSINLWELTNYSRVNADDRRSTMIIETPAFTWNQETVLKELECMEIWIDRLWGDVNFKVEYRPDSDPCWYPWSEWKKCTARNSCEDAHNPVCYPVTEYSENYRAADSLPRPQNVCQSMMGRPTNIGYQFQLRITVKGFCRIRSVVLHATTRGESPFQNLVCSHPFEEGEVGI